MKQLTEKAFAAYLEEARDKILVRLPVIAEKPVNYGYQFTVAGDGEKAVVNIYNGKKGLNIVYAWDCALTRQVRALLEGGNAAPAGAGTVLQGSLQAGSDESGKGDFFGPLVVSAVMLDAAAAACLQSAGVRDCKLLTDKKILELEPVIKEKAIACSVLELKPKIYNLRYEQVAAQGGNLNQLLGLGHVAALTQILERHPDCDSVLIDQFTKSTVILQELRRRFPGCKISQQPRAEESNPAVAAASVLARACFLRRMAQLAEAAGEAALPKGGGAAATECARRLARKLGKDALRDFVKLHFANYKKI